MEGFKNRQRLLCMAQLRDAAAGFVATHGHEKLQQEFLEKAIDEAKKLCHMEQTDRLQLELMAESIETAQVFMSFATSYESRGLRMSFMRLCQAIANRSSERKEFAMIEELMRESALAFEWFIGEELMRLAKKEIVWCYLDTK
jgi:hypothetical protein